MNLRVENINFNWNSCIMPNTKRHIYSNLAPLKTDTISFGAMKKSEFGGFDLFVINKFKAPIEKFNTNDDLQNWCEERIEELKKTNLEGRQEETTIQRKATFKEWCDYVLEENDAYTNSISLLILDSILKGIKPDNDTEIPPLNKGVLAQTIDDIQTRLKENPKAEINFNKEYRMNLQKISLDDLETHLDSNETGWVVIPSKEHDPENFEENVDRLKTLSHKNWCTASFNAEPYLSKGDFHVYLENGRPKLGIRFKNDKIAEIQGEKNNSKIPLKYLEIAREHKKNNRLSSTAQEEFEQAEKLKKRVNKIEKQFGINFKTCPAEQLFNALNIKCSVDPNDGLLILDEYRAPDPEFDFEDLGRDENKLFKEIKEIKGNADFRATKVTNLGNLKIIGGNTDFERSRVIDLGNLQSIMGDANFENSRITDLKNLKNISGDANFINVKIPDLGNLQSIGGSVNFYCSNIVSLGNLQSIEGNADFYGSNIADLGNLQSIGGYVDFRESKITNLDNLRCIGGDAYFEDSQVISLGNLETIKGGAHFVHSKVADLGNLQSIGGDAKFGCSNITELGKLRTIGGTADFTCSKITSLGNLYSIGGSAYFGYSNISELGNLYSIGRHALIRYSKLQKSDFENIKVGGIID